MQANAENIEYQAELARSLVKSCGLATAINYSQNNRWKGVLRAIPARHARQTGAQGVLATVRQGFT
jgi:hypothetical protein